MQPLLCALEREHVAQQAERLVVGDAKRVDLEELDRVLHDMDPLDDHDGNEQRIEDHLQSRGGAVAGVDKHEGEGRCPAASTRTPTSTPAPGEYWTWSSVIVVP